MLPLNSSLNSSELLNGSVTQSTMKVTGPIWSFIPTFYVVVTISALLTNGAIMVAFITRPNLRTSFNVYLMNLVSANFIYAIIQEPADIINNLYTGWWLGSGYCSLYLYGTYIFEAGIRNCHLLITVNRIWAVMWPHSYRNFHNKRTACLVCLGAWAYVHLTILPGYILDALYYRNPLIVNPCYLNADAQWKWALAIQIVVYNMTLVMMLVAYPIIWYKRRDRQKKVNPAVQANFSSGTRGMTGNSIKPIDIAAVESVHNEVKDQGVVVKREMVVIPSENAVPPPPKRSSHAFTILTVLTISVTICWTPMLCYYTITIWVPINNPLLLQFGIVLFAMQSVLDPILFVSALPDLQETFRKVYRFIFSC